MTATLPPTIAENGRSGARPKLTVTVDAKGKLILPAVPAHDDLHRLCEWLTVVFALDPNHPITGGKRTGSPGPDGHARLTRAGAPALAFEPVAQISQPARLIEALGWRMIPTDSAVPAFKAEHCRLISQAVRMLCGAQPDRTPSDEAAGIVGFYLGYSECIEGMTIHGTTAQRYEAANALQTAVHDRSTYLLDAFTGEYVIRVADLADAARRHEGRSVPHGWLDARMDALGWPRVQLSGYSQFGREGRRNGRHARCDAYRGFLPADGEDESVNT